jgi:predicted adenine nucleotide alpha hydrolase (AANH) superfamily ATPase
MKKFLFIGVFGLSLLSGGNFSENLTSKEACCFDRIFYELGTKYSTTLWKHETKLKSLGDEVRQVAPLDFLSYVLKTPKILSHMRLASKRTAFYDPIWPYYMKEFKATCNTKKNYELIQKDLALFAEDVGVSVAELQPYVDTRNWNGFVKHLLKENKK